MFKLAFGIVLIMVGFFKTIFHDPVWGLYLFAAFSHIRLEQLGENYTLPLRIPIVIACLTLFLYLISPQYRRKFSKWPAEVWLFGVMVLGMCLGSAFATFDPPLAWERTLEYFKYWIFFILFIQMIDSVEKLDRFHWVMVISSAWLVYRCWDLRGTTGIRFENVGGGNVGDANNFAAALVLLFPFAFDKIFSRDWRVSLGTAIVCLGSILAILVSGSRGGFLGLMALLILVMLSYRAQRKKILAVIVVTGLLAVSLMSTTEDRVERLSTILDATSEEQRDSSAQGRIDFWTLAFQLFREHPWVGVGPDNFRYYSGYMLEGHEYGKPGHVTHSLWFEMLTRGVFVFVPFVIMLVTFFLKSSRLVRRYRAAGEQQMARYVQVPMIGLGAFLIPATFLDRSVYEPIYWCIGLGVIHQYLAKEHFNEKLAESNMTLRGGQLGRER